MAKAAQAIPKGFHTVTPSIVVAGAAKAIDFYRKALGAEEVMRFAAPKARNPMAALRSASSCTATRLMRPGNVRSMPAASRSCRSTTSSGVIVPDASRIRSVISGGWPSTRRT